MMSNKWTVVGVAAAGIVGVAAIGGTCFYLLSKEESDFKARTALSHNSSRPVQIHVQVPVDHVGRVIGRGGRNLKEIESKTSTRIHFKDELETDTMRVLSITGQQEDVKFAEILIYQVMSNVPSRDKFVIDVPTKYIGNVIGRDGEVVRHLEARSGCKIDVEKRPLVESETRKVALSGSLEQIKAAKRLIENIIEEEESIDKYTSSKQPLFLTAESDEAEPPSKDSIKTEELEATSGDLLIEVYVSSVNSPNDFHVQKVGPKSVELDKLVQNMSSWYESDDNQLECSLTRIEVGDLVAAKCAPDGSWYRARVINVTEDEYEEGNFQVELYFVDFGEEDGKRLTECFQLKEEFLQLSFQAISCKLADVKPNHGEWTSKAIDEFESLTHAFQWKPLLAKVMNSDLDSKLGNIWYISLIDTSSDEDIDIAEELVKNGYAISTLHRT